MIIGPDLDTLRTAAKTAVMQHFVGIAESDGTPPTLRAMYVMKVAEARTVLDGGASDYISGEAAIRGNTPEEMAAIIVEMAKQSEQLELARMRTNVAIEGADSVNAVCAILEPLGVTVSVSV